MEAILARFSGSDYRLYLSGPTNFRDTIACTRKYKGDRPPKPRHYLAVGGYLEQNYGAKYTDGEEADDIIAKDMRSLGDGGIIVSTDKDLDQVAGRHYNWVTGDLYTVSRRTADFNFWTQVLTGDPTDNVPGLSGIGPATADKLLGGCGSSAELRERVKSVYADHRRSIEYFVEQASLIKIGERFDRGSD